MLAYLLRYCAGFEMTKISIQPRKIVLDHAEYTAPTQQHELDDTDQEYVCPESLDHEVGIDYLSGV